MGCNIRKSSGTSSKRASHLRALAEFSAFLGSLPPCQLLMFFMDGTHWPYIGCVDHRSISSLAEWTGTHIAIDPKGAIDILFENNAVKEPCDLWARILIIPPAFISVTQDSSTLGSPERDAMKARAREALEYILETSSMLYDCRENELILYDQRVYGSNSTFSPVYAGPPMPYDVSAKVLKNMLIAIMQYILRLPLINQESKEHCHQRVLDVVSRAWVATFPDTRDVFDFYAGQKDGLYYAAKPECLHHQHRGIYEQALRIADDATLAFACIMSERGGVPIDISEGTLVDDAVSELAAALRGEGVRYQLEALHAHGVSLNDLLPTFPSAYVR